MEKPDPIDIEETRTTQNLSEAVESEELDKLSPLGFDFQGQKFSSLDNSASSGAYPQIKTHTQATSGASTTSPGDRSYTLRDGDGTASDKRYIEKDRGSWINIQLVNKNSSTVDNESLSVPSGEGGHLGGSLDRVSVQMCGTLSCVGMTVNTQAHVQSGTYKELV